MHLATTTLLGLAAAALSVVGKPVAPASPVALLTRRQVESSTCDAFLSDYNTCHSANPSNVKAFLTCICTDKTNTDALCTDSASEPNPTAAANTRGLVLSACNAFTFNDEATAEACYNSNDYMSQECQKAQLITSRSGGATSASSTSAAATSAATAAKTTSSSQAATSSPSSSSTSSSAASSSSKPTSNGALAAIQPTSKSTSHVVILMAFMAAVAL